MDYKLKLETSLKLGKLDVLFKRFFVKSYLIFPYICMFNKQFAHIVASILILVSVNVFAQVPEELKSTKFSDASSTPSPACLCAAPTGEVFVGVDMLGSLGKGPGKGKIIRLVDTNGDGIADTKTLYANLDNPRGLVALGTKLLVLHTVIPKSTGKLSGMHLSVLEDKDWDGVADGKPKILISDISPPKHNQDRGADHTTNGIRMGIDGWIYIAVGDFGIHGAKGTDGTELTMLGGGVVRVRPDGTEMEVYTTGLRNIYDVAIDPYMNIYTRGNTNDGGGWNVRFIHHIQTGEYGYPMFFKNFTNEIIPALVDLGGGSGTGAMFLQEPGWPEKYNNIPIMCDWGRSQLIIHRLTPDGASFTQEPENFIRIHQITDVDTDASGRLYAGAWAGAGYKGSPDKGWVERIVPKNWVYKPFLKTSSRSDKELIKLLWSESSTARLAASQELVKRSDKTTAHEVIKIASDQAAPLHSRVAAIFTFKQILGNEAAPKLSGLIKDQNIREWVIRALTDRKTQLQGVKKEMLVPGLKDPNPRVNIASAVALGRLGDLSAANALLDVSQPPGQEQETKAPEAPPAFETKAFKGHRMVPVNVDVSNFKELYLVVTDGGDGDGEDHGVWFNPFFEDQTGKKTKLSSLKWKSAKSGWGKIGFGISATGAPLKDGKGKAHPDGLGTHANSIIVYQVPKGAKSFKAKVGLANTSKAKGKIQFIVSKSMPPISGTSGSKEGPHAKPNPEILLPHVAVKALISLKAIESCVDAIGGPNSRGAHWALKMMHDDKAIDGLITKYNSVSSQKDRSAILATLIRLYQIEAPYDGSWWWSTRPDTRGPYYKPIKWESSEKIETFIKSVWDSGEYRGVIAANNAKTRSGIQGIDIGGVSGNEVVAGSQKTKDPIVDLNAIARTKGQVGKMSIEDVILAIGDVKGDSKKGEILFTKQGCVACHTLRPEETPKGPYMGQVGAILSRDQIAESILKPNASISQGFATVSILTKDNKSLVGFITSENADAIEMRDISGKAYNFKANNIKSRTELKISMMPAGLANSLSVSDFASLLSFLEKQKG